MRFVNISPKSACDTVRERTLSATRRPVKECVETRALSVPLELLWFEVYRAHDFPNPILRCYAPETALAEKFEAVVNLGLLNSRMKDYFDFWVIGHQFSFEGEVMKTTIRNTFSRRGTSIPTDTPAGFSEAFWVEANKQAAWRAFWKKAVVQEPMIEMETVVSFAASLLLPPALAAAQGQPFTASWEPGGPWNGGAA